MYAAASPYSWAPAVTNENSLFPYSEIPFYFPAQFRDPLFTCIFWKAYRKRRFFYLFFEQIFFIEKENNRRIRKPFVVADGVEQFQTFLHSILKKEAKRDFNTFSQKRDGPSRFGFRVRAIRVWYNIRNETRKARCGSHRDVSMVTNRASLLARSSSRNRYSIHRIAHTFVSQHN